jgi:uncharacterized membrane protein
MPSINEHERRGSALGWLSLGLGLVQLLATQRVAQLLGIDEKEPGLRALRLVGARELVCGVGLLSKSQSATWAWARVAGDVMDLALVGSALRSKGARSERLLIAGAGVVGATCLDVYTAYQLQGQARSAFLEGLEVHESVTIARSPEEVYAVLRDFQSLPQFLSRDIEIIEDRPGKLMVWRSGPDAEIPNQGRLELRAVGGLDTELHILLRYDPPAGKLGAAVAQLFARSPSQQLAADLRRVKQVLETGEVLHSDASIHRGLHPARPSELSTRVNEQVPS